jgi:hypothetical protein
VEAVFTITGVFTPFAILASLAFQTKTASRAIVAVGALETKLAVSALVTVAAR